MSYLFILFSFLFIAQQKDPQPTGISLNVQAQVQLPADQINFNINVNAEADSPQAAYSLHKKREKALVNLLDTYNIKEKNIRYQPISISKQRRRSGNHSYDTTYVSRQHVNLTFSNPQTFEKMQIGLIEHHFDSFSAHFTSTKLKQGQNEALKKALKKARKKAQLIAEGAGVTLGPLLHIAYNTQPVTPRTAYNLQAESKVSSGSLLKYNSTVTVNARVSLRYAILNKR